jgi:translation initiation factor 2B subunit (eIF-2B alpha/beta/delta family)
MCRRVLHIIREEADAQRTGGSGGGGGSEGSSDDGSSDGGEDGDEGGSGRRKMKAFKSEVIEVIGELIEELESVSAHITQQALEHISPQTVVFTSGGSELVESFLREANRKRKFQTIVAEGAPGFSGHRMARTLSEKGLETTVVSDSAVFAVMSRANIVVIAAHGVFSNGGVLARAGDHTVALAAKQHAVPVVVLAGLHELSPLGPGDPEFEMNDLLSPADMIGYTALADCLPLPASGAASSSGEGGGGGLGGEVGGGIGGVSGAGGARVAGMEASLSVANPAYDYIPPELVTFFITDAGGQVPAFVRSLLGELYSLPIDHRF